MDIPRTTPKKCRWPIFVGLLILLGGATWALGRLEPAAPTVDRSSLWIESATSGPFVREVRGHGTLVPEHVRQITAESAGRVERLLVEPGALVLADTVLVELSNPEILTRAREAELASAAAEADFEALRARIEREMLDLEAQVATVTADALQAQLQVEANEELAREGLVSALILKISRARAQEMATRKALETRRLAGAARAGAAQEAAQRARLAQLQELLTLRRAESAALYVRAGLGGVLQEVAVEPGQRVLVGADLARVADPGALKAELRVPETQARDLSIGLPVLIDTRNGTVKGRVVRIDPAVREGTVLVDIGFIEALPRGARPDLTVDGTIEIERLDQALTIGRPAFAQADSPGSLFKLSADGRSALRVKVEFGRGSVQRIEVRSGLVAGDRIILSDTSSWDASERVRLQ